MGNPLPVNLSQECRKADKIIKEFVDPVNGLDRVIPLTVLRRAKGFAIFSIFRVGFVLTARAGSGVVIAKLPDGTWSAPSALGIAGIGGGFSAGAEVTDFIVVLNSRSAVKSFMATGSLQLGGNLSLAVGPLGRSAEAAGSLNSSGGVAAMFSYSKSQGLFGGVSLEGTALVDRSDANSKAYNRSITAKQILSGAIDVPVFAQALIGTIERLSLTGRMAEASRADEIEPGAGRDSWSMDDGDRDFDFSGDAQTSSKQGAARGKKDDGFDNYFSQAELDSRQRKYERGQLNGGGMGSAYSRSSSYQPSLSDTHTSRRSPSPSLGRSEQASSSKGLSKATLPSPGGSASTTARDPFATMADSANDDPYSIDRDDATRHGGAYGFSSQAGGSVTNSPKATRGEGITTPGGGRKRADSRASFKGGYFDDLLSSTSSKEPRAYSPIDGKRPSTHRKGSSSLSIPKFGRKTPPAFGGGGSKATDTLMTGTGNDFDDFNERFPRSSEDEASGKAFSSGDRLGVASSDDDWQRGIALNSAGEYGSSATTASSHRPSSSRKGSSSLFSFGNSGAASTPPAAPSSAYNANSGLKKTTPADAIRAAAAGSSMAGSKNDAFSDIWDAEKLRASSNSYSNGLDSLDEELQRGGSLRRNGAGPSSSTARGSPSYTRSYSNQGNNAGYTSFSDDVPDRQATSTSRFSPVSFFRTNSGGIKKDRGDNPGANTNSSSGNFRTGSGGGFRTGSGAGFRSGSGAGFRTGSGGGFRSSSRNSNNSASGGGGLANFVGVGAMSRGNSYNSAYGSASTTNNYRPKWNNTKDASHLLDSSSDGEGDLNDAMYSDRHHSRRLGNITGSQDDGDAAAGDYGAVSEHRADDLGLGDLNISNHASQPASTNTADYVVASFDFAGQEADDLRFNRGDVITVLKRTDSTNDWWLGKTADGRVGSFPANFVEEV